MSSLFTSVYYIFAKFITFMGSAIIGDLGFSLGIVIIVFFVLGLLIDYLIPGVVNAKNTINSR